MENVPVTGKVMSTVHNSVRVLSSETHHIPLERLTSTLPF